MYRTISVLAAALLAIQLGMALAPRRATAPQPAQPRQTAPVRLVDAG